MLEDIEMKIPRRRFVAGMAGATLTPSLSSAEFKSDFSGPERPWPGADYWSNPLQDWRVRDGRLECIVPGGDRNLFLLTREIAGSQGDIEMKVRLGRLEEDSSELKEGFVGFRLGIRGHFNDYRDSAVRGVGLNAGISSDGRLFIGELATDTPRVPSLPEVRLRLRADPSASAYSIVLEALDGAGNPLAETRREVPAAWLPGGIALVCSSGPVEASPRPPDPMQPSGSVKRSTQRGGTLRFWFKDWTVSGSKITAHPDRSFGPILFAMHTLSRGILKLTAQMAPVATVGASVQLQTRRGNGWRTVATTPIDALARTATFRVPKWDDRRDVGYRVAYGSSYYTGTIRHDPRNKPRLTIAALTCNNDFGFPHADIARSIAHFKPDLLLFTGDQIYERVGEYGNQLEPLQPAMLDYLRKWYLFGWAYGDRLRDIPTVTIPDDHDDFHGNVWGAGGRRAEKPPPGTPANMVTKMWQDSGGYKFVPEAVNAIQRTQTAHLPDPFDPAPTGAGIGVYYTSMLYGGVSLAILEDRKWKSAPKHTIPWAIIENGWAQNPSYDAARDGDVKGAELLGARQISFLEKWAQDWSGDAFMKVVVSQTLFANLATLPAPASNDDVTPGLAVNPPGVIPKGEVKVQDHDSNGWPQSGRNTALRAMRKAVAFHIGGDQHLGSTVQYGIDAHSDAAYCLCTPAISNIWPRRWYPPEAGANRSPGSPYYTGEFLDGFGNRITVHAVANPMKFGAAPATLHDRAPGYGIVEIDRATRQITLTNWPRHADVSKLDAKPYAGWPITMHQYDNGLTAAPYRLDSVEVTARSPVVQVIEEATGEIQYTLRPQGSTFVPKVFRAGRYTVKVLTSAGRVTAERPGVQAQPAKG